MDEVILGPLRETRQLLPELPIFLAVPPLPEGEMPPLLATLGQLGVGLYVIETGELRRVLEAGVPFTDDRRAAFAIRPDAEYRNKRNVSKMLLRCNGDMAWLDKHFTHSGFPIIYDHLSDRRFTGISGIRILTGVQQITTRFRREFTALGTRASGPGHPNTVQNAGPER